MAPPATKPLTATERAVLDATAQPHLASYIQSKRTQQPTQRVRFADDAPAPEARRAAAPETPHAAAPETPHAAAPETPHAAAPETPHAAAPSPSVSLESASRLVDDHASQPKLETDFVEHWLDDVLGRAKSANPSAALGHRHLYARGLSRASLDRMYRALLVHATALQALLETEVAGAMPDSDLRDDLAEVTSHDAARAEGALAEASSAEAARLRASAAAASLAAASTKSDLELNAHFPALMHLLLDAKHHINLRFENSNRELDSARADADELRNSLANAEARMRELEETANAAVERARAATEGFDALSGDVEHERFVHRAEMNGMQKRMASYNNEVVELTTRLGEAMRTIDGLTEHKDELEMHLEALQASQPEGGGVNEDGSPESSSPDSSPKARRRHGAVTAVAGGLGNAIAAPTAEAVEEATAAATAAAATFDELKGNLQNEIDLLKAQNNELVAANSTAEQDAAAAKKLYADEVKNTAELEFRIESLLEKLAGHKEEMADAKHEYEILESSLAYEKMQHEATARRVEDAKTRLADASDENARLSRLVEESARAAATLTSSADEAASDKERALSTLAALEERNAALQLDNDRVSDQYRELYEKMECVLKEDEALKDQLLARTNEVEKQKVEFDALQEAHVKEKSAISQLRGTLAKSEVAAKESKDQVDAALKDLSSAKESNVALMDEYQKSQNEFGEAKRSWDSEKLDLGTKVKLAEDEKEALKEEVEVLHVVQEKHEVLMTEHSKLEGEHAELAGRHEVLEERAAQQQTQMRALHATVEEKDHTIAARDDTITEQDREITVLTSKVEHAEQRVEACAADLKSEQQAHLATEEKLEKTEGERQRLESGLTAQRRENEKLHRDVREALVTVAAQKAAIEAREEEVREKDMKVAELIARERELRGLLATETERMMTELRSMEHGQKRIQDQMFELIGSIDMELRGRDDVKARIESMQNEMAEAAEHIKRSKAKVNEQLTRQAAQDSSREQSIQDEETRMQRHLIDMRNQKEAEMTKKADEHLRHITDEFEQQELNAAELAGLDADELRRRCLEAQRLAREASAALAAAKEDIAEAAKKGAAHDELMYRYEKDKAEFEAQRTMWTSEKQSIAGDSDEWRQRYESEASTRVWREKYALELSAKIKDFKVQLLRSGRQPILLTRGTQTSYAELWCRNILDPEERAGREHTWVDDVREEPEPPTAMRLSLRQLSALISAIYQAKVQDDVAAARKGAEPKTLREYVYVYMIRKYGLPPTARDALLEVYRAVKMHASIPEIERFGVASGLLVSDDEDPPAGSGTPRLVRTFDAEAVEESMRRAAEAFAIRGGVGGGGGGEEGSRKEASTGEESAAPLLAEGLAHTGAAKPESRSSRAPSAAALTDGRPKTAQEYETRLAATRNVVAKAAVRSAATTPRGSLASPRGALLAQPDVPRPHTTGQGIRRGIAPLRRPGTTDDEPRSVAVSTTSLIHGGLRGIPSRNRRRRRGDADLPLSSPRLQASALTWDQFAPGPADGAAAAAAEAGALGSGSGLPVPSVTNLLGLRLEDMHHALNTDLTELVDVYVPWTDPLPKLVHPAAEEAGRVAEAGPGVRATIKLVRDPDASKTKLGSIDLGLEVTETQLPQLHVLLERAADVMHYSDHAIPKLFVKPYPAAESFAYAPRSMHPCIVLSTRIVELLTPLELQCEIAAQLCMLRDASSLRRDLSTAATIAAFAPELLPRNDPIAVPDGPSGPAAVLGKWKCYSDLTGDRAALCVIRDERIVMSRIMKLATGSPMLAGQLDLDAILETSMRKDDALRKLQHVHDRAVDDHWHKHETGSTKSGFLQRRGEVLGMGTPWLTTGGIDRAFQDIHVAILQQAQGGYEVLGDEYAAAEPSFAVLRCREVARFLETKGWSVVSGESVDNTVAASEFGWSTQGQSMDGRMHAARAGLQSLGVKIPKEEAEQGRGRERRTQRSLSSPLPDASRSSSPALSPTNSSRHLTRENSQRASPALSKSRSGRQSPREQARRTRETEGVRSGAMSPRPPLAPNVR